jgi:acyl-CoA synthetase (AMP-forming)/AMP-acid ligase II/acyl carrier protein
LPSAYWHHWVDELDRLEIKLPPSLRLLIVGNDRVSADHFKRWQKLFGKRVRWLNAYGPTEATITATLYEAPTDEENWHDLASVPIGRPMTNRQTYVLDRSLRPQPIGVAGELFIGGAGLARGYLNRPELTAEKFIANPFSSEPGARLYRTGDLVRYLADGNIEFLGRADDQVKVRGYRIELAEIEAVLIRHPAIHECVVVAREDSPGDKRLAAYVVAASGSRATADELRRFLKEKLPEFMIPAVFVFLAALPLTPNGKVDRKALPAPDLNQGRSHDRYVAPRTAAETKIAEIWSAVLKADKIGVHDNFFDIGGHSLLAMQVISRVREAFQIELRVRQLFEAPTVSELAQGIEKLAVEPDHGAAPSIARVQRDRYKVKLPG